MSAPVIAPGDYDSIAVGGRLRKARLYADLTPEAVAARLGEKIKSFTSQLSRWETGKFIPDRDRLVQLARLYNTTVDWLLDEVGDPPIDTRVSRGTSGLSAKPVPGTLRQLYKAYEIARDSGMASPDELAEMLSIIEAQVRSQQEIHASTPEALELIVSALKNDLTGRHRVRRADAPSVSEGKRTEEATEPERKQGNGH